MVEMSTEQRLHARDVHNDFFKKTEFAIEHEFYLEAMMLEYSAMEARMQVILSILDRPCALCKNTKISYRIGLVNKVKCLKTIFDNNPSFFKESCLKRSDLKNLEEWCNHRNERIHGLYSDTEKYEKLISRNKKYANQGYKYASLLYEEAKRLRVINRYHREQIDSLNLACHDDIYVACIDAKAWIADNSSN